MARSMAKLDLAMLATGGAMALSALVGAIINRPDKHSLLLVCYFLVGMCGCGLVIWLGKARLLAYPGMLAAAGGLLICLWFRFLGPFEELIQCAFLATAFFGYSSIMHAVTPRLRSVRWVPHVATGAAAVMSASFAVWIMRSPAAAPLWLQFTTAAGAGVSSAIAMIIVPLAIRAERRGLGLETTGPAMTLTCPRCGHTQTLCAGRARCDQCRLIIRFEIAEPRCVCGFALYRLTGEQCPECGKEIPPEERWRHAA